MMWETLKQDLRYTLRSLRRAPGFALTAVFVTALFVARWASTARGDEGSIPTGNAAMCLDGSGRAAGILPACPQPR